MNHPDAKSPALREALDTLTEEERVQLEAVWGVVHRLDLPVLLSPERVDYVRNHLEQQVRKNQSARQPQRMMRLSRWRVVAVGLVGCFIVMVLWFLAPTVVTVPPGETRLVVLPDGTHLELNSEARLTYNVLFDRFHRRVTLDGEAFFQVPPGEKPFVVETVNAELVVLGTQFNVHVQGTDSLLRTDVFLAEGRVRLTATREEQSVVLDAGQASAVIGIAGIPSQPRVVSPMPVLAWRPKELVFRDFPLAEIFEEIEARYAVEILTPTHPALEKKLSYFAPHPVGVERVLKDLCQMAGLQYRRTLRGYEILVRAATGRS